jgi:WD40 repeat protein
MYKFHKFARKHRAALATAVAIAASLILGTTASAWQAVRATTAEAQANANATRAEEKANEATTQRDLAKKQRDEVQALNDKLAAKEQQLQRTLYASDMNLALHAWEAGNIRPVRELLERHRPHPGESDLRHFEWHYLNRLCHQELLTLDGRSQPACHVAYSPDGKRLASTHGGFGKPPVVWVWDAQTGRELFALEGAGSFVAFSPDGKRLATGGQLYQGVAVKIWDAQTGQELTTLHTGVGNSVAFSPDGKRLACDSPTWDAAKGVYGAGKVKVWDVQTGRELLVLKGHTGWVSVAYSPDGKRLASAGQKLAGEPLAGAGQVEEHAVVVGEVKVWDAETGQEVFTVEAPALAGYQHRTVAYSPDGKRLTHVSCSDENAKSSTMIVWDAQTGQELLTQKTDGQITSVAFSPDGKRLATGAGWGSVTGALIDRAVRVWDAETGQELYSVKGHASEVTSVAFSPDGSRLASACRDGTVKVWDATTSQEARAVPAGILSPAGKHLAGAVGNEVKVWDTQTGRETLTLTGHTARVESVAFSPDGQRLVSAAADRTVKVWDAQTGRELLTFKGFAGPVDDRDSVLGGMGLVAFSPDGQRLVSGARPLPGQGPRASGPLPGQGPRASGPLPGQGPRLIKVWDAQTGKELFSLQSAGMGVFSPDGKRLASGSKVWDSQTGKELLTLQGGGGGSLFFSLDGRRLTSLGVGRLKVWDAETGQELHIHTFPADARGVVFSPDGRRIAGGGKRPNDGPGPASSGEIKVWDAETGRELLTLQGHTSDVWNVAFSPDGQRLASGSPFDPTVRVWDAQTGQELLVLKGKGSYLAFSRDGHCLVTDRQLWDATPLPEK